MLESFAQTKQQQQQQEEEEEEEKGRREDKRENKICMSQLATSDRVEYLVKHFKSRLAIPARTVGRDRKD